MKIFCFLFMFLACCSETLIASESPKVDGIDRLPVLHQHRVKPFAIAARESLLSFSTRSSYTQADGQQLKATTLHLAALQNPQQWAEQPIIRIAYKPLREHLELPESSSLTQLKQPAIQSIIQDTLKRDQIRKQRGLDIAWNTIDDEIIVLLGRIYSCEQFITGESVGLLPLIQVEAQAVWALQLTLPSILTRKWQRQLHSAQQQWAQTKQKQSAFAFMQRQHIWLSMADLCSNPDPLLRDYPLDAELQQQYALLSSAIRQSPQDSNAIHAAAASCSNAVYHYAAAHLPEFPQESRIASEMLYHRLMPFTWTWILYILGGICTAVALLQLPEGAPRRRRMWLWLGISATIGGVLWNIAGFAFRLHISSWGAVTNLYETVVYVALIVAILGLCFAAKYKKAIYAAAAGIGAGFCACVAAIMPLDLGAEIGALQPVLRSKFWLWVHVKVIVASYGAFLLAWVLANMYLAKAAWCRERISQSAGIILYRCLQVGVLLCIAGTLLGAVWADQAWGRFWGWDPKEVWALVVIIIYLIPLHLRLIGVVSPRGLAAWSIFGFPRICKWESQERFFSRYYPIYPRNK